MDSPLQPLEINELKKILATPTIDFSEKMKAASELERCGFLILPHLALLKTIAEKLKSQPLSAKQAIIEETTEEWHLQVNHCTYFRWRGEFALIENESYSLHFLKYQDICISLNSIKSKVEYFSLNGEMKKVQSNPLSQKTKFQIEKILKSVKTL